jgi:hypothetical protein
MSTGYEGILTPYNTKEFEAVAADLQGHFNGSAQALTQVGVDLRRLLPNAENVASGRRGLMGADLQVAAWQVSRQFGQAAAAQRAASAAVVRAHQIYYGTFHNPGGGKKKKSGRTFDAG